MADEIGQVALSLIRMRARSGVTTGRDRHPVEAAYLERCTHLHWRTGTLLMFTRDTGHHSSGWFKNPQFERCLHLSLSFREPMPCGPDELASPHRVARMGGIVGLREFDTALAHVWVKLVLGDAYRLSWEEGAFSREGRELSVRHWRVFCDPGWQAIKPQGEVYSREATEKGWLSWSEKQGEDAAPNWISAE